MLNLKYQNFNFYNPARNNVFCKSYTLTEKQYPNLGSLFLILSIEGGNIQESSKIADVLQEIANHEYFRQNEKKQQPNISKNFEFVLNKINQALATLAESGHVQWVNKLHLALAAICDNEIQFTYTGNIKILLLRDRILLSLIHGPKNTTQSPAKVFSNIVSGALRKNDKLIFTTPEFFDYFSEDNLKKIIQNAPNEACAKLQNTLSCQQKNISPISAIFAEIPEKSIAINSESKNPKIKSNSFYPNLEELNSLETRRENLFNSHKTKNNIIIWLNKIKNYFVKILSKIKNAAENFFSKFKTKKQTVEEKDISFTPSLNSQTKKIIPPLNFDQLKNKFIFFSKNLIKNLIKKFNRLPKTSKILFVTSCIFALAFIISITGQIGKRNITKKDNQFDQLLKEASEKEKLASDALIYQDFDKAKNLLTEAKSILEKETIQSNKEKNNDVESLLNKINEQFDKVDKIVRIKEPTLLVESAFKIEKILGLDDMVYSYDPKTNAIYQLEEEAKRLGTISSESKNTGYFKKAAANSTKKSLIFVTDTPAIAEFNLSENKIENLDITFESKNQEVKEILIYNDRLYLLDTNANQIFKHTRTISGYSKGIEWIKENDVDLKNAASFAIDGKIYLLNQDGSVLKFSNGKKEDFMLASLSKPLDSPTKIFTLTEQQFLYILDPKNNRVVVFDKKNGKLKNQYVSDAFTDLKDIYVNEEAGKIYLLCGQRIFGIVLEK